MGLSIETRMWAKSKVDETTGCWLWNGHKSPKGYGFLEYKGKNTKISRLSAHLYLGLDINNKKELALHKAICPNKNCWCPSHLYIGTYADNALDSVRAGTNSFISDKRWW